MKVLQFPTNRNTPDVVIYDDTPLFDVRAFWETIKFFARKMGFKVLTLALTLYYVFKEESTPLWAKAMIGGALAYLIMPLDFVPDLLPGGWVDDCAAMTAALYGVKAYVTELITKKAEATARTYFDVGEVA